MAKIIMQGNHVFMRHWLRWYKLSGKQAHRIKFNRGQTVNEKRNDDGIQSEETR